METFIKIGENTTVFAWVVIIIVYYILHGIRKRKDALLREHDRILEEQNKENQENFK